MLNNVEHIYGWSYTNKTKEYKNISKPLKLECVTRDARSLQTEIETDSERWKKPNIVLYLTGIFWIFSQYFSILIDVTVNCLVIFCNMIQKLVGYLFIMFKLGF